MKNAIRNFLFLSLIVACVPAIAAPTSKQKALDAQLVEAVSGFSNINEISKLIAQGANVNAKSKQGYPIIVIAVAHRNEHICKLLLDAGADVKVKDKEGRTALMFAASTLYEKRAQICQQLIDAGIDVNAQDNTGKSALMYALYDPQLYKLLIDAGADVNAKDKDGKTVLMEAASRFNTVICKILLDAGANPNAKNNKGETALMLRATDIYPINMRSASIKFDKTCKLLIDAGADINLKNKDGKTALDLSNQYSLKSELSWAIRNDNAQEVENLLIRGANLTDHKIICTDGTIFIENPLVVAASRGNLEICKLLIKHGANTNMASCGARALTDAARMGRIEICKLLLTHGAQVNAAKGNANALVAAADSGREAICKLLIAHGADVNACNGAAFIAVANKDNETYRNRPCVCSKGYWCNCTSDYAKTRTLLIKNGADINAQGGAALREAARMGNIETCKILIAAGANVNIQDDSGATILMTIAGSEFSSTKEIEICNLLIAAGANVNAYMNEGLGGTALQIAALYGKIELCKLLIKSGADVNSKNKITHASVIDKQSSLFFNGSTPLIFASLRGKVEVCKLLINAGATVDARNAAGKNALDLAVEMSNMIEEANMKMEDGDECEEWDEEESIKDRYQRIKSDNENVIALLRAHNSQSIENPKTQAPAAQKQAATRWARMKAKIQNFFKRS